MKSVRDLRRSMSGRAEPGETGTLAVAAVLARLKELGYLSDERFAADYTRLRQENEKFGERRVRMDLQQKGVHDAVIGETVEARYGQTDEVALARQFLERKRLKKPENEKETARVMRRLVMAGFATGTIRQVLRQWDVPEEALTALDSLDADLDEGMGEE